MDLETERKTMKTIPQASLQETIVNILEADPKCVIKLEIDEHFHAIRVTVRDDRCTVTSCADLGELKSQKLELLSLNLRSSFHDLKNDN